MGNGTVSITLKYCHLIPEFSTLIIEIKSIDYGAEKVNVT